MSEEIKDPCASFGKKQFGAMLWMFIAIFGGAMLAFKLASTDAYLLETDGVFLDNKKYAENRKAATSIASDSIDPRQKVTLSQVD